MKHAAMLVLAVLVAPLYSQANPAIIGRLALVQEIEDLKTLLPVNAHDPISVEFSPRLEALKKEGLADRNLERRENFGARVKSVKAELVAALYEASDKSQLSGRKSFERYIEKQLNADVAQRELSKARPVLRKVGVFVGWNQASLSSIVRIDSIHGYSKQPKVPEDFKGSSSDFSPRQSAPEKGLSEPPVSSAGGYDEEKLKTALRADGASEAVIAAGLRWAHAKNMDPRLVFALMKQESAFRVDAVSGVGAQGLMQLMPGTARDLGVYDGYNINQNVRGGTAFLASLWASFKAGGAYQAVSSLFSRNAGRMVSDYAGDIKTLRAAVNNGSRKMIDAAMVSLKPMLNKIPLAAQQAVAAYNAGEKGVRQHDALHRYNETRAYVALVWYNTMRYFSKSAGAS